MRRRWRGTATVALALALAGACAADDAGQATDASEPAEEATTTTAAAEIVPGAEFAAGDPVDHGLDPAALEALDTFAEDGGSNCVAVAHDGVLVHESYWNATTPETDQEIFSATKSITAFLVGIAEADGLLDLDDPAAEYIPAWRGTPSAGVTIRNLLSNDSGRYYDFETDYLAMAAGARDKTAFAVDLDQAAPPGTTWAYNNSAIQTLEQVLEEATGDDVADFAEERLFAPLGMTSEIAHDPAGNTLTFMGAQAGCQDLARFGLLALREGRWGDEQVVPADFVRAATSTSQELNSVYGYLWWVNSDGPRIAGLDGAGDPVVDDGRLAWPDAPADTFAAQGLGGQLVVVIPSEDLVITRLGPVGADLSTNDLARLALGG